MLYRKKEPSMEKSDDILGGIESFTAAKIERTQPIDIDLSFCCIALQQPLESGGRHAELVNRLRVAHAAFELETTPQLLCDELHKKNICYALPAIPHRDYSLPAEL
jgi:hypothetical protein